MKSDDYKKKIAESSGREKGSLLLQYSNYLLQIDTEKSCLMALEALKLSRKLADREFEILCQIHLGYARLYNGNFEQITPLVEDLLIMGKDLDNQRALGAAYNLKADVALQQNKPDEAIENYLLAERYYRQGNIKYNQMSCLNNLGKIHHHLKNYEEAYHYMALALEIGEELQTPTCDTIRMNMGSIKYEDNNYEQALELYQASARSFKAQDLKNNEAYAIFNIGLAYGALDKPEQQLECYNESYRLLKEINDWKELSRICRKIAEVYIDSEEYSDAMKYLEEGETLARSHELESSLIEILKSYAHCLERQGLFKQSLGYMHQYLELHNAYMTRINNEKIAEMNSRFKTEIYRLQNQELKEKTRTLNNQIGKLAGSLKQLREEHKLLEGKFQSAITLLNTQDNLISSQSRMAVMGEMISLIAHQWRQPLNVIGILVQSFQDAWEYDDLSEEFVSQQVTEAMEQIKYMSDMITDFRNFFKPEGISKFNLKDAIENAIHLLNYLLQKSEIELETELSNNCFFNGVRNDITQVILNLMNNARDAMLAAGISKPLIRISLEKASDEIVIRVFNKGEQIPEETVAKLFQPYFTTKEENGTGIGLYLCQMIIENKYKGKIRGGNCPEGVEFIIRLPLQ